MPKGNIVQETIPLKVRIESQPEWDRRTFSTKVLNYMKSGTMKLQKLLKRMKALGSFNGA